MDTELALILKFSRKLPSVRGAGVLGGWLRRLYLRKPRMPLKAPVLDFMMRLDPAENIDSALLFYPQLYEHREIRFLRDHLREGDVFLDVGANVGFYSLIAAKLVGRSGSVLAIEADPVSYQKLCLNLELNGATNVWAVNIGVSDVSATRPLYLNINGNRGGNSLLDVANGGRRPTIDVECNPLTHVLASYGVKRIDVGKFDIEGMEYRVLDRFFADADPSLYPRYIIVEHHPAWVSQAGGDVLARLARQNYAEVASFKQNHLLVHRDSTTWRPT
jgi:FkbM family methyltransferase